MRSYIFVIIGILINQILISQVSVSNASRLDSLQKQLLKDSVHTYRFKKYRPYLNIDNRKSFIEKRSIDFRGLQLGVVYMEKHTFGIGFYKLFQKNRIIFKAIVAGPASFIYKPVNLNTGTAFYQYKLVSKRFFQFNIMLEIGLGIADVGIEDSVSKKIVGRETIPFLMYGEGLQLILKPVKWFGISLMGGHRFAGDKSERINFNGFYYSVGIWIDFRQIYRDIKYYKFIKRRYKREIKNLNKAL